MQLTANKVITIIRDKTLYKVEVKMKTLMHFVIKDCFYYIPFTLDSIYTNYASTFTLQVNGLLLKSKSVNNFTFYTTIIKNERF